MGDQWAKAKLDSLFFHWLSSEQGIGFVKQITEDVKNGRPIHQNEGMTTATTGASPQRLNRKLVEGEDDLNRPGSPTTTPSAKRTRKKSLPSSSFSLASPSLNNNQSDKKKTPVMTEIPPFYVPGRTLPLKPINPNLLETRLPEIQAVFKDFPNGIAAEDLLSISKNLLDMPTALNVPFFRRIRLLTRIWKGEIPPPPPVSRNIKKEMEEAEESRKIPLNPALLTDSEKAELVELESGRITLEDFLEYWKREIELFDEHDRFFRLVKQPGAKYVVAKDFFPFVKELIDGHPGLEFLESTPEFQEKYARTVVARIFHRVNTSWSGEITQRELRKSDLLKYFALADEEEEINAINEYFSYEHFYVIYCKFWELDSDHDLLLSKEDLFRHGGHSLTKGIVDRIFQQPCRPFSSGIKNKMGFEDFCFFILCEEDKANPTSIRYWFNLVDVDGDGYLRPWEIRHFYEEQLKRMKSLGQEEVPLNDVLAQMKDCLGKIAGKNILYDFDSDSDWVIELNEFLKPDQISVSGSFFNLLFNLNKFLASESRDPFSTRLMQGEQPLTEWDRFALAEYGRLASAEEARSTVNQTNINTSVDDVTSRLIMNTNESDSDGSEEDEEVDDDDVVGDDDDDDDDDDLEEENSSQGSGSFNTKGLRNDSPIFSGNLYQAPKQEIASSSDEDDEQQSIDDDGLEQHKRSILYSCSIEDFLSTPESRYNVPRLWRF